MIHRALSTLFMATLAHPVLAYPCSFQTECFEAEPCADSTFEAEVFLEDQAISTEFGELTIVAVKEAGGLTTLFATGDGAEYLMSVTASTARLTVHTGEEPQVISYLGSCTGTN